MIEDLHEAGRRGPPALFRYLLEKGALDGEGIAITGRTLEENVSRAPPLAEGQPVIRSGEDPSSRRATSASGAAAWRRRVLPLPATRRLHQEREAGLQGCVTDE